jgi:hypothetical protein
MNTAKVAFILLLSIILSFSIYYLYLNFPQEEREFIFTGNSGESELIEYSGGKQFSENMRYPSKKISYTIDEICDSNKKEQVLEAFRILEVKTILEFYPSQIGEIKILCSDIPPVSENEDYFIAGEGGPASVLNTSIYDVILEGKISLFRQERCNDLPIVALHEILHSLGFEHNDNPGSVLYPTLECDQEIDDYIIEDLNDLYEQDSASDLKIEKVEASKSGKYLDFYIEVLNQGLISAKDVPLTIYHDEEAVEFDDGKNYVNLGEIGVGVKKILNVTNAKISRSSENLRFVIDVENNIVELFENNNEASMILN